MNQPAPRAIALAVWVFRQLLRLPPRAFREAYGPEMTELFVARCVRGFDRGAFWRVVVSGWADLALQGWRARRDDRLRKTAGRRYGAEGLGDRYELTALTLVDHVRRAGWHAARALFNHAGFSTVVIVVLSIGVGATTALFTLVDRVVLRPLPYSDPQELVTLTHASAGLSRTDLGLSLGLYFFYSDRARSFESIGAYSETVLSLVRRDLGAERINITLADPAFFRVFRVVPELGRLFTDEDARPGFLNTTWTMPVLIADDFWRSHFAADVNVIGQIVTINDTPRRIVGVLPAVFAFPRPSTQVWMLWGAPRGAATFAGRFPLQGVARLKPGITPQAAAHELSQLLPQVVGVFPDASEQRYQTIKLTPIVTPLKDALEGGASRVLWTLFAGMFGLLLIAGTNVAALFAVRLEDRRRDIAIRLAIGAERHHIVTLFLAEALLLTGAAALLGLLLARGLIWWILAAAPIALPRAAEVSLDGWSIAFAGGLCGVLAIFYSVLSIRSQGRLALSVDLAGGSRSTLAGAGRRFDWFLAMQVSLALILMVGSGLMVETYANLSRTDLGFQPTNVLTADLGLPYREGEQHARIYQRLVDRLSTLPGVTAASAASFVPLTGSEDMFPVRPGGEPVAFKFFVPGYFAAMKTRVTAGTSFDAGSRSAATTPVLISAPLARDLFPRGDPLGKSIQRFTLDGAANSSVLATYQVVGVVSEVLEGTLRGGPAEAVYIPELEPNVETTIMPTEMTLVVRTAVPPLSVASTVRRAVAEVDPTISVSDVRTLDDIVLSAKGTEALVGTLLLAAASVSLLLGVIGVYGSVAQVVRRRTREIGVRIALGAEPVEILQTVAAVALTSVGAGAVGGLGLSYLTGLSLKSLLFGVQPADPLMFGSVAVVLLLASCTAALLAGGRAVRVSPVVAMRVE